MSELPDTNVEAVIKQMRDRMEMGYIKYNTTTDRTDIDFIGWLQHLQEELMDACVYVERLKKEVGQTAEHLLNTSVSCAGYTITIECNDHDTKDFLFDLLTAQ